MALSATKVQIILTGLGLFTLAVAIIGLAIMGLAKLYYRADDREELLGP